MNKPQPLAHSHPPRELPRMFEQLGLAKAKTDGLTRVLLVGGVYWAAYLRGEPGREA